MNFIASAPIQNCTLEQYFSIYRENIAGQYHTIKKPYHEAIRILYADWAATGRAYLPIENRIIENILPFMANPHSHTTSTAEAMTLAWKNSLELIKKHVGANEHDMLITSGSGMTGVINKFQRILGLRLHESFKNFVKLKEADRPVVFLTHMEHHSNQVSWLETIADVCIVAPDQNGQVSPENFSREINNYKTRRIKIAAITACSNVTGIVTPYYEIAELMHQQDGYCFVDFTCGAPYIDINMHPDLSGHRYLDAIFFSPHKFLGGQGTSGVLIANKKFFKNTIPDEPGGGTVNWTNPWEEHKYNNGIEIREGGGTPPLLQIIRTAMSFKLKAEMGVQNILKREEELLNVLWNALKEVDNIHILASNFKNRLGIFSFYIDGLHHHLAVRILNDRFGIQARGGCSCAGTYGHYLLNMTKEDSRKITNQIDQGDLSAKPGWIRLSLHPTLSTREVLFIAQAVKQLALHYPFWIEDYHFIPQTASVMHKTYSAKESGNAEENNLFKNFN